MGKQDMLRLLKTISRLEKSAKILKQHFMASTEHGDVLDDALWDGKSALESQAFAIEERLIENGGLLLIGGIL